MPPLYKNLKQVFTFKIYENILYNWTNKIWKELFNAIIDI